MSTQATEYWQIFSYLGDLKCMRNFFQIQRVAQSCRFQSGQHLIMTFNFKTFNIAFYAAFKFFHTLTAH